MKEKILAALKTKYKNFGFGDKAFEGVADYMATTVTEETQIETAITGVESLLKGFQSEADKLRNENTKLKKLITADPPKTDEPKTDDPKTSDPKETPEWAKAILASNTKLETQIAGLQAEKTQQTHMQKLVSGLKEKKVPESYYSVAIAGRTFKDESEVDAFLTQVTEAFGKHNQELANKGLSQQPVPVMGVVTDPAKEVSPMMSQYLKDKETDNKNKKTA